MLLFFYVSAFTSVRFLFIYCYIIEILTNCERTLVYIMVIGGDLLKKGIHEDHLNI